MGKESSEKKESTEKKDKKEVDKKESKDKKDTEKKDKKDTEKKDKKDSEKKDVKEKKDSEKKDVDKKEVKEKKDADKKESKEKKDPEKKDAEKKESKEKKDPDKKDADKKESKEKKDSEKKDADKKESKEKKDSEKKDADKKDPEKKDKKDPEKKESAKDDIKDRKQSCVSKKKRSKKEGSTMTFGKEVSEPTMILKKEFKDKKEKSCSATAIKAKSAIMVKASKSCTGHKSELQIKKSRKSCPKEGDKCDREKSKCKIEAIGSSNDLKNKKDKRSKSHSQNKLCDPKIMDRLRSSVEKLKHDSIGNLNASNYKLYQEPVSNTVYQFCVKNLNNELTPMSKYEGGPLLIINFASNDSLLTLKNLVELNRLFMNYNAYGLNIAAFPSNDFGCEPLTDKELVDFVDKHQVKYQFYSKISVTGMKPNPKPY